MVEAVENVLTGHGLQEMAPLFASVSVTKPGLHCKQAKLVALYKPGMQPERQTEAPMAETKGEEHDRHATDAEVDE